MLYGSVRHIQRGSEMTSRFSANKVKDAAIQAMLEAGREYADWTESLVDSFRARAPELFYQVKIAERIRELPFSPAVSLEYTAKDAVPTRRGRRLKILEGNKNIDILVAPKKVRGDFQPFQIALEIKRNAPRWRVIEKDVQRLTGLVHSEGFRMGLSLFLMWHPVGEKGEATFVERRRKLKKEMKEYGRKYANLKFSLIDPQYGGELVIITRDGGRETRVWHVSGLVVRR